MQWIDHHGLGCPVTLDTIVETIDPSGEVNTGPAGADIDGGGNGWIWEDEFEPQSWAVVRYRVLTGKDVARVRVLEMSK